MAISFAYGSQSSYDNLITTGEIVDDALYLINDTNRIYRGSDLIVTTNIRFVSDLPENLIEDTIYVVTKTVDGNQTVALFVSNGENATAISTQTSGETVVDETTVMSLISKFKSSDVSNGSWDEATDDKLVTAGAFKMMFEWVNLDTPVTEPTQGE